jgi:lipopolysaccharide export system protein LptA
MRSLRWFLLVAILLVLAAVARIYQVQRTVSRSQRRAVPAAVALDTKSEGQDWEWGQSANGQPQVKLFAKSMKQSADLARAELEDLELRIYQKDGLHYDRVKTATATFTTDEHKLYAPGDAQITLDVPVTGEPAHQLTSITTAGINFDSTTGQAVTDKHVSFTFENGDGTCTGASYDPTQHRLDLHEPVLVNLKGNGAGSKPMKVESAHLTWDESTSVIQLDPWSRLTREQTVVNAGKSTILIKDNVVNWIDAEAAKGTDQQPGRHLEYSADMIHEQYNGSGQLEKVTGTGNARLVSHGNGSDTTVTGNHVDLFFTNSSEDESVLSGVAVNGNGYLESKPEPDPAGMTADTKVMKSEILDLRMRPGGKDLDRVSTRTPGTLEFLPNQAARHRRLLKADRMDVVYGAKNEIQSFIATAASTETYPSELEKRTKKQQNLPVAYTSSKTIDATFDEHGQLKSMKQSENFRYTEGIRKAQSDSATLENETNIMTLDAHARISDDTGSTSADRIRIEQNSGNFDATGHVSTTRLPEKQKSESAMLNKDEPTQGTADRVTSADHNENIRYIGHAVVWQSSNRIQAERIDIDRDKKTLVADGNVTTQFQDDVKDAPKGPAPRPIFTVVHSQHMVYTDPDRLANYTGGVDFRRPSITVKSTNLKAWLNERDSSADSRLNRAQGDGKVEIVEAAPDRQRVGTGEHAEYYTDEGKVVLSGGEAQLNDSKRGNTKGGKLTYFTGDDRLLVDGEKPGAPDKQVKSHLRKKS